MVKNLLLPLAILMCCVSAHSQNSDATVLGVELGARFSKPLEICKTNSAHWCLDPSQLSNLGAGGVFFLKPPNQGDIQIPSWAKVPRHGIAFATGEDGAVNHFSLEVEPVYQIRAIETIRARFGEPTTEKLTTSRTALGATLSSIDATWSTPALEIITKCTSLTSCYVRFVSRSHFDKIVKELEEKRKKDKL